MIAGNDYPLGLRREALRVYARPRNGGGRKVLELVTRRQAPRRPQERGDLDRPQRPRRPGPRRGRQPPAAAEDRLGPPPAADPRAGPPRTATPTEGRAVFAKASAANACASCHRVQGQGQWVGPDLSTIGTKYGKEELLRSILYPSAAIGYNYKSNVLALADGRVLTGLVVEEAPDRIVLKTADGKRLVDPPGRRRGPQDHRGLADARRAGRGDDRPRPGRPPGLPGHPEASR